MAWLRIDDRIRTHPKIAMAGPSAAWLWLCGLCYCREHLTDGFVPKAVVPTLALNLPSPWKHAARLVEVGLWEEDLGGYRVHDFLDWNPSKSEVMSLRDKERDKKRTQRGHSEDSHARTRDRAGDAGSGSSVGSGSVASPEESPRETAAIVRATGGGFRPGTLVGDHRRCAVFASVACARGKCVPGKLVSEWMAQLGHGPAAEDHIRQFVAWALEPFPEGQPIGDDAWDFWRAAWRQKHGSQMASAPANTKGAQTVSGVTRGLQKYAEMKQRQQGPPA